MSASSRPSIGFIGLGAMGSRMARRLLDAGYRTTVWNRTPERGRPLAAAGATLEATPLALAGRSDMVLACVTDDAALHAVLLGADGALDGMAVGSVFIDMSTVSPEASRCAAEAVRKRGARMLDAPVLGSLSQAEQGQLAIFVGGDERTYAECRPILEILGSESFYMGANGTGATMKLVASTVLGVGLQAMAEALALGLRSGLDRYRLLDVLARTDVIAPAQRPQLENVRRDAYSGTAVPLRLMLKDFGLILTQAAAAAVPMPAAAVASQMCAAELRRGADDDYSATIRLMLEIAHVSRPSPLSASGGS
jgi:3-hydroxyisobutyrate dehydrogenase-like beta-hydroxyacid dehydrogenase